eukprot:9615690-Ditylum_brightwellii.AAC.1
MAMILVTKLTTLMMTQRTKMVMMMMMTVDPKVMKMMMKSVCFSGMYKSKVYKIVFLTHGRFVLSRSLRLDG